MSEQDGLPIGWSKMTLNDFCSDSPNAIKRGPFGSSLKKECFVSQGFKVYEQQHAIQNDFSLGRYFIDENKFEEMRPFEVVAGDLIISCSGTIGRIAVVPEWADKGIINQALLKLSLDRRIIDIGFFVNQFQHKAHEVAARGSGMSNLAGVKELKRLQFVVPPINEQHRIVAKIEELFSDLDAAVAALERAKSNLKRYRAAVLKASVEGKLTEEWRAEHSNTEPAAKLLERILIERRLKWEAAQLAKLAAAKRGPPKNWKDKYVEPTPADTTGLPSIPESWIWATLDMLADVVGGVTKDQKKANQPGMREVPYLRVANVQRGFLDLSEMKSISTSEDDIAELRLEPGDVLFTEGGDRDKLGRGWVWSGELSECIHQNHIFRGRLLSPDIQPRFVSHHGNTFGKEWFIKAGKQTTNLASINLGILRRFPVPMPPAAEQAEIVAQVDEKLSQIDAAETQIEHSLHRARRLRQSILKQAFQGKLVPQDPTDELASFHLGRGQAALRSGYRNGDNKGGRSKTKSSADR